MVLYLRTLIRNKYVLSSTVLKFMNLVNDILFDVW
jgi:hypothetical protein